MAKQPSAAHAIVLVMELIALIVFVTRCQPQPVHGDDSALRPAAWLAVVSSSYAAPVLSTCNSEQDHCDR